MATNYYKILQVSTTVSKEEIENAYRQLIGKWQHLRAQQTPEMKARSDKLIAMIEEAYHILSIEKTRAIYDRQLQQTEDTNSPIITPKELPEETPPPTKKSPIRLFAALGVLLVIAIIIYVLFIPNGLFEQSNTTVLESTPVPTPKQQTAATPREKPLKEEEPTPPLKDQTTPPQVKESTEETSQQIHNNIVFKEPKDKEGKDITPTTASDTTVVDTNQLKNANDPILKETAKRLAELTNNHKKVVINFNTQFVEAKASNQNVTLNFMVIDGISNSRTILDSYLTERFFYDNQICDVQKDNIAKGILFTFAYYNTQKELIGKYYIDKQVCDSPMEKRLIKTPTKYQLDSIEIGEDGKPIAEDETN